MQIRPKIPWLLSGSNTTHMLDCTASSRTKGAREGGIAVIEEFEYDPYGQLPPVDAEDGASPNGSDWKYVFQGECCDAHADLYEFRERAFDPAPGGWIEQEPTGYVDCVNLYLALGAPSDAKPVEIKPIEAESCQPNQHADHSST